MIKTAIIGATGYSGETLVSLLARHPQVEIAAVTSRAESGKAVPEVMPRLRGVADGLTFTASDPRELAKSEIEVCFLALPHGAAASFAEPLVQAGKRVIDLSADFRLGSSSLYEEYYGSAHPAPELLQEARYVLPEVTEAGWQESRLIACPGCYPTSILLPLLPLLRDGLIATESIIISAASGVSGAGKKESVFYSYAERTESMTVYGVPRHRHLSEIEEQLSSAAGCQVTVQFTPHLIPMRRGILTTIVARPKGSGLDAIQSSWKSHYEERPFVRVLEPGTFPDTGAVTGTNRCDLSVVHDKRTGNLLLFSAIDNLVKGASGQAVQILNLLQGWPEETGLR